MRTLRAGLGAQLFFCALFAVLVVRIARLADLHRWTETTTDLGAALIGPLMVILILRSRGRFWGFGAGYLAACVVFLLLLALGRRLDGRAPFPVDHPLRLAVFVSGLLVIGLASWYVVRRIEARNLARLHSSLHPRR